jgi:ribosomal protein S6
MERTENEAALPLYLYEIAYLVSPLVMAENVGSEVDKAIRTPIATLGGVLASELTPILRPLAYPVGKTIGSKRQSYKDAYFGAARFELDSQQILVLKDLLDKNDLLIRFMIMRLPKSADKAINPMYRKILAPHREASHLPKESETPVEARGEVDKAELDKEIEGLLETKATV